MAPRIITAEDAAELVRDGMTIAGAGFGAAGVPEEIICAIEKRCISTGAPQDLTIITACGNATWGDSNGMDRLAREGCITRVIAGFMGVYPKLNRLIEANKAQGYNLPQGTISHLFRAIAANQPGVFTKVGLRTFVDPRLEGGKMNESTTEDMVKLVDIDGEEWLHYSPIPIDMTLLRGTTADEFGNISFEDEGILVDSLAAALATKASGGTVMVQVKHLSHAGTLRPHMVHLPGNIIDVVVVCTDHAKYHRQLTDKAFDPAVAGHFRIPLGKQPKLPLDAKKAIGRRAAMELTHNSVVNLGIGTPEFIGMVAAEEGVSDEMTLTVESGIVGGVPLGYPNFGYAVNYWAILQQQDQFEFYDGGGLDIAFLGMAQVDRHGNVNASKYGKRFSGCGGFINISQSTHRVVFCGMFTANGLKENVSNGQLDIQQEGSLQKFIQDVEQITFSGDYAIESGQDVMYVTERAVFRLVKDGLMLTEIAPGVDLEKDILAQMEFTPLISDQLTTMTPAIFRDETLGLKLGKHAHNEPIKT